MLDKIPLHYSSTISSRMKDHGRKDHCFSNGSVDAAHSGLSLLLLGFGKDKDEATQLSIAHLERLEPARVLKVGDFRIGAFVDTRLGHRNGTELLAVGKRWEV